MRGRLHARVTRRETVEDERHEHPGEAVCRRAGVDQVGIVAAKDRREVARDDEGRHVAATVALRLRLIDQRTHAVPERAPRAADLGGAVDRARQFDTRRPAAGAAREPRAQHALELRTCPLAARDGLLGADDVVHRVPEAAERHGDGHGVLRRKVLVEGRLGDPDVRGDLVHARRGVPAFGEEVGGRVEDRGLAHPALPLLPRHGISTPFRARNIHQSKILTWRSCEKRAGSSSPRRETAVADPRVARVGDRVRPSYSRVNGRRARNVASRARSTFVPGMPPYASLLLDVDSTLTAVEGIDWLAARRGPEIAAAVAESTERAMRGDLALDAVYGDRLARVRPTRADCAALAEAYAAALAPGAAEALAALRAAGVRIALVSGGLRQAILPLARTLGFAPDDVHAVDVVFDMGGAYFAYDAGSPLATQGGKAELARRVLTAWGASARPALGCGDGSTDLALRGPGACDALAAFTGVARREAVVAAADHVVDSFAGLAALVLGR